MTQPSEEQVRAWLQQSADEFVMFAQVSRDYGLEDDARRYEGTEHLYRAALALLDAGRKDRERLDGLAFDIEGGPVFDQMGDHDVHEIASADAAIETDERCAYCRAFRAAIDQARGA